MNFFTPLIRELTERGHSVDIACNNTIKPVPQAYQELGCRIFTISCTRSPTHPGNFKAVRQLRDRIRSEKYDIVHCHTPVAAFCTRIACWNLPCRVIYTAHGFHFFKGAPLKNWLLFYPAEKFCAGLTDILITINQEDYAFAQEKLKARRVVYVPGVGIDLHKFQPENHGLSREALGIPTGNRVLLSVGELIPRKNHETLIRAAAKLENVTVLIAGTGPLMDYLRTLAQQLGCDARLLGYREDIAALCHICDVFVLPSFQEGLPVALMEAMACGKAVSCSRIRGNTDLVGTEGGTLFDPTNADSCYGALKEVLGGDLAALGQHNREAVKAFSLEEVNRKMIRIYEA